MSTRNQNVLKAVAITAAIGFVTISGMQAKPAHADFTAGESQYGPALSDLLLARQLLRTGGEYSTTPTDQAAVDQITEAIFFIRQIGQIPAPGDDTGPTVDPSLRRMARLDRASELIAEADSDILNDVSAPNPIGVQNEAIGHIISANGYVYLSINDVKAQDLSYVPAPATVITKDLIELRQARGLLNMPNKFDLTEDDKAAALHIEEALLDAAASNYDDGHRPPYIPATDVTTTHSDRLWQAKRLVDDANHDFDVSNATADVSLVKVAHESQEAGRAIDRAISDEDGRGVLINDRQYRPTGDGG